MIATQDFQAVVDEIRGYLSSSARFPDPNVSDWATEYARLCRDANARLRKCADYLKRGLRGEAVHCAESAPDLLDFVVTLDFPEVAEWRDVCLQLELASPPPLLMDAAASLNEAYASSQPVTGLMARHRLLALGRAPLNERLAVMRQIEASDPAAGMADDIATFERQRLEEIRSCTQLMAKSESLSGIRQLQSELNQSWTSPIPTGLRAIIDSLSLKLGQKNAEADIRRLIPDLNNAYSAMAEDEAQSLVTQIRGLAEQSRLAMPADLQDQIDPVASWLEQSQASRQQQAEFQAGCDQLQQAIDIDAATPQLEKAYRLALAFQLDLPPELENRYRRTLLRRATALRHKRRLTLSAIVGAFILLAGITATIVYRVQRSNEIAQALALIDQAKAGINAGQLDISRQSVKRLQADHSRIAGDSRIIGALADFNVAASAEQNRKEDLSKQMAAVLAAGIDKPDMKALDSASQLAKTSDEQKALANLKAKIDEAASERQSKIDEQFLADVNALSGDIDRQLAAIQLAPPMDVLKVLDQLAGRIADLQQHSTASKALLEAQTNALLATLQQRRESAMKSATVANLLDNVAGASSVQEQVAAIKAVMVKTSDPQITGEFQRTLRLADAEKATLAWGKLSADWAKKPLPDNYDDASSRAAALKAYLNATSDNPLAKPVNDYLDYINLGQQIAAPDGPWKKKFHDLMQNPLLHDLYRVATSDGKCYYTLGKPTFRSLTFEGKTISQEFKAIITPDVSQTSSVTIKIPETIQTQALSPQAVFANGVLQRLDNFDFAGWENIGTRCEKDLLAAQDMDPILKAVLMQDMLELNQGLSSWAGDTLSAQVIKALDEQNIDDVKWMDPNSPAQPERIQAAKDLVAKVKDANLDQAVNANRAKIMASLPMGLKVCGVLMKQGGAGTFDFRGSEPLDATAACLYAISDQKQLIIVARRKDQQWSLDSDAAANIPAGSLLFVATSAR